MGFGEYASPRPNWLARDLRGGRYLRRVRQLLSRGRAAAKAVIVLIGAAWARETQQL
jgi:hypothetical protein